MDKLGSLLGGKTKTTTANNMVSPFQSLPGFAQNAYEWLVNQGLSTAQNPSSFTPMAYTDAERQALGTLQTPFQPLTAEGFQSRLNMFSNPFENQVIGNTLRDLQTANQGILGDIGQRATAAGGFGGTRQAILEAEANKNLGNTFGNISGNLRMQNFNTATGNVLDQFNKESLYTPMYAQNALAAGTDARNLDLQRRNPNLMALPFLNSLLGGIGQSSYSMGSTETKSKSAGLGDILNLAGGIGSLFRSDERLKENIAKIGEKNGHNIYEFNYKGTNQKWRGVIAQEIEKTNPDAVIKDDDGYLAVNYNKLGLNFEELQNGDIL